MSDKVGKTIYYVSNLGTGKIGIIDGNSYKMINTIDIDSRPQNIIVDENDNVFIASDRIGTVTLIDDSYDLKKVFNMPNNGNIQVDCNSQRIYVSNTEEVCIYSLITGEKMHSLIGFMAINCLKLDRNKERLFVLDILNNEIKVYKTSNIKLIKTYKNIGIAPSDLIIGDDGNYLYIGNRGSKREVYSGNISIVDIEEGSISYINLQKGSTITGLDHSGIYLYAANNGLHRIEVINLEKKESVATIKTSLPIIQRIRLSPNKKTLLAISRSADGKSVLDKIDAYSHAILDTFTFKEKNSIPNDIGIISEEEIQIREESFSSSNLHGELKQKNGITILAQKVLSVHQEEMTFSDVSIHIPADMEGVVDIENINFKKCEILTETIKRKTIENKEDHSVVEYDFYIPYRIHNKQEENDIKGRIRGTHKATLYIPDHEEQKGVKFVINTFTQLANAPVIDNYIIKFDLNVLISTNVIVDEIVCIPHCKINDDSSPVYY